MGLQLLDPFVLGLNKRRTEHSTRKGIHIIVMQGLNYQSEKNEFFIFP
ncbi:hypothetical protein SM124_16180 [Bacillus sp. 31A1R]|uniref:Uncharacterized protein n=1 Tax=Robertmurraya mangrovi TaxID=3098077 RepID=A0ABU5J1H8_9BACI|nr:hypothetical protein [Bacillus sp. 31A1R]